MNIYLAVVVALLLFDFFRGVCVDLLNLRHLAEKLPPEFEGWYDEKRYAESQRYLRDETRLNLLAHAVLTAAMLAFILLGGFGVVDELARAAGAGLVPTGLFFGGILLLLSRLVHLPFDGYSTFVLEERYGFNKTRPGTFVSDELKGLLLTLIVGGALFAAVLWFFSQAGTWAWLYAWVVVGAVQMLLIYVAPVLILPLFNKFTPLEDGELKRVIQAYAAQEGFALRGVFTMDGSRRSTKANAYFTGFGRWRRVVLFDTLVEKHTVEELVAILAHEVGHYKLRHIPKHLLVAMISSALMFYLLSLFIRAPGLYGAFGVSQEPVGGELPMYAGMVFFGFLYAPMAALLAVAQNVFSRRHEYAADAFAARTAPRPEAMVSALKRLAVQHLSNLTPHPLKVFLEYSHPPVLARLAALKMAVARGKGPDYWHG